VRRRTVLKGLTAAAALPVLAACDGSTPEASTTSAAGTGPFPLVFDKTKYTTHTQTVSTGDGSKKVTYRFYAAIPYVRHPVNTQYQSLDVSVPVEIDGRAVNASAAPILFSINVGGYVSSPVQSTAGAAGGAPGGGAPGGAAAGGAAPGGGTPPTGAGGPSGGSGAAPGGGTGAAPGTGITTGSNGQLVDNGQLALAAGYVVVAPGCRGRDNVTKSGRYYGKAPAAIVDLKAAVRYVRYNKGRLPGNPDWIVSTGGSAGGALSTLLAASGDSPLYDAYLSQLGAASVSDAIFASASYSPITDLDHSDMAYEWMYGHLPLSAGQLVDQTYSRQLTAAFTGYQASLGLRGKNGFGPLTAANYADYLVTAYLQPAATRTLGGLTAAKRAAYLRDNPWIAWSGGRATFTWAKFLDHMGTRLKSVPAFDSFTLSNAENIEFGDATSNARHFTRYSLRHATGNPNAELASDLPAKIAMMNPMYFLRRKNPARAKNWWIRTGTLDTNTAHTVVGNLAALVSNLGDTVNSAMYWDGGHAVNYDAPEFIRWTGTLTGYPG
jgi:BD-FAE